MSTIPPIDSSLTGTDLVAAINDRLRRLNLAIASAAAQTLPQLILSVPGALTVLANAAPLISLPVDATPTSIVALVKTAPSGGACNWKVSAAGLTIGAGAIASGTTAVTQTAGLQQIPKDVAITLAIGNAAGAHDLTVMVRFD